MYRYGDERLKPEAFVAFAVGVAVTYGLFQVGIGWGWRGMIGRLLGSVTIVPFLVGGAWYHFRRIV